MQPQPDRLADSLAASAAERDLVDRLARSGSHIDDLWAELTAAGTPLLDPASGTATFLFRHSSAVDHVQLHVNRITDKDNAFRGRMTHVPGTDIWVRTLDLSPSYRGSYGFIPMANDDASAPARPPFNSYTTLPDPHSRAQLAADGARGLSVVAGPAAEGQPHWPAAPTGGTGTLVRGAEPGAPCPAYLYLPAGEAETVGLVTVFDAEAWFDRMGLTAAIDAAVAQGMPPVAVLGVANESTPQRIANLSCNRGFLDFVGTELAEWAMDQAAEHGVHIDRAVANVLAGQSLGGLSALYAALCFPARFSAIIAQSPSLWWTPEARCTPADLPIQRNDWITQQFWARAFGGAGAGLGADAGAVARLPRIFLEVGARESVMAARSTVLARALERCGWPHQLHVYDGGHDYACWRGGLMEGLASCVSSSATP